MKPRQKNKNTAVVFGTACTAGEAENKLAEREQGSFLIRDSSVEGLITISYKNDKGQIRHSRIGLVQGGSGLKWVYAPADKEEAKAFAEQAKNAFQYLEQYPKSFLYLLTLITRLELDMDMIIRPLRNESSHRYGSYTFSAEEWIESPELERPNDSIKKTSKK